MRTSADPTKKHGEVETPTRRIAMCSLLVRPSTRPGESSHGYRLRLAHVNGLGSPAWLQQVAGVGSLPANGGHVRWCPMCLKQEHCFWMQSWNSGTPICIQHQCWLVDTCDGCKRPLTWRTARYQSCRCGTSLTEIIAPALSSDLVTLSRPINATRPSSWWAALPLERRWKLVHFLGALHAYGLLGKPLKKASVASIGNTRDLITSGAANLLGGEQSFHELLCRIRIRPAAEISAQLLKEAFPTLLGKMRRQLPALERQTLFTWVRSFLLANSNSDVSISWKHSGATVSAAECARHLNVRAERLSNILSLHGIASKTRLTTAGRTMLTVAPKVVREIRERMSETVSRRSVSTTYGLSSSRQTVLMEAGLIRGIAHKVDAGSVAALIECIPFVQAKECRQNLPDLISLDQLLRTLVPLQLTEAFFRSLLNGEIRCERLTIYCSHLRDLAVSRNDIQTLLDAVQKPPNEFISIPDAASQLNLKQEVVYHLVNHGVIKVVPQRIGRRLARFVKLRELARFTEKIESLVSAASRHGISRQAALSWANETGKEIVSGPTVDGGRQYFIRKAK